MCLHWPGGQPSDCSLLCNKCRAFFLLTVTLDAAYPLRICPQIQSDFYSSYVCEPCPYLNCNLIKAYVLKNQLKQAKEDHKTSFFCSSDFFFFCFAVTAPARRDFLQHTPSQSAYLSVGEAHSFDIFMCMEDERDFLLAISEMYRLEDVLFDMYMPV